MLRTLLTIAAVWLCATPALAWEIETGTDVITPATSIRLRVDFSQAFAVTPVVIAMAADSRAEPVHLRVSEVDPAGFTVAVSTPPNTLPSPAPLAFSYIAVEPGNHLLPNGGSLKVGSVTSASTSASALSNITWSGSSGQPPAVLTGLQTDLNSTFLTAISSTVSSTGFGIAIARDGGGLLSVAETLGYIAIEPGVALFDTGTDPLPVGLEALSPFTGVGGPDDDVDGNPLTSFPLDCSGANLRIAALGAVAGRNGIADPDSTWARQCTASGGITRVPLTLDQDLPSPRTASGDRVSLIAFERAFHATIGLVADYHLDRCDTFGAATAVFDSGPYALSGQGQSLVRVDVTPLSAPAPLCYTAGMSSPSAEITVAETGSNRLGVTGALTVAAWANPKLPLNPGTLQTVAGKGGDSYRLSLEAVCVSVPLGLSPAVVLGSPDSLVGGLCADPLGVLNAEWKLILRADITTLAGLSFTARSASTAISALWDPSGEVAPEQWSHTALTYDGTQLRVFLNGVERSGVSVGAVALPLNPTSAPFAAGVTVDTSGGRQSALDGALDEVSVWNLPLPLSLLDSEHRLRSRDCTLCRTAGMIYWRERLRRD